MGEFDDSFGVKVGARIAVVTRSVVRGGLTDHALAQRSYTNTIMSMRSVRGRRVWLTFRVSVR